jgi:succinate dehydrogenase / fumarate reductase iron-sulfur subunit
MEQDATTIEVRVRRDGEAELSTYRVPAESGMSVFNVLERIRSDEDPTLAFLISCRIGKCDICLLKVNGKTRWSCTELATDGMVLEPLDRYEVAKDLVVDWEHRAGVSSATGARAGAGGPHGNGGGA